MRDFQTTNAGTAAEVIQESWKAALLLGMAVFLACLLGILTRPTGFLASLWPANAIMLGLMLRIPSMARPAGWLCAALAYMAADFLTGSGFAKAAILNGANLAGVATAWLLYARQPADVVRLRHPAAMLHLVLACAAAGVVAGIIGGFANPFLFDGTAMGGWVFWFSAEFVNYVAILPVILSAQPIRQASRSMAAQALPAIPLRAVLPGLALMASCLAVPIVGGPGAIAFTVPALLWCGLSYAVFPTALLTLASSSWVLVMISDGFMDALVGMDEMVLVSLRLGVSLIAVAPIMVSCVMQNRNALLARLQHLATHDVLTGASSRGAFQDAARILLRDSQAPVGVMMLDLDHFKPINDNHGHAAGDMVLTAVAGRVRHCLRTDDLFGRLGGEEFAVVVGAQSPQDMLAVAQRIRETIAATPVLLSDGTVVSVTVSIGIVIVAQARDCDIDTLLAAADTALYRAKDAGRNQVVLGDA